MHVSELDSISNFLGRVAALTAPAPPRASVAQTAAFLGAVGALRTAGAVEPSAPAARSVSPAVISTFLSAVATSSVVARRPTPAFDIWKVTGMGRSEVRNTSILAWALNPRGSHGKGAAILNALLARIRRGRLPEDVSFPFPPEVTQCFIMPEALAFADQADRVDILMDGPGFTAFIEVKVDAAPDAQQVMRYVQLSEQRAKAMGCARHGVIFLAPSWAKSFPNLAPRIVPATWDDVAAALLFSVALNPGDYVVDAVLRQFASHVRDF